MKIKRKQLLRLKEVLQTDRNERSEDFLDLVEKDLTSLLKEYFEFEKPIYCELKKDGGEIKLSVNLTANRIKPFGIMPE